MCVALFLQGAGVTLVAPLAGVGRGGSLGPRRPVAASCACSWLLRRPRFGGSVVRPLPARSLAGVFFGL